MSENDIRDIRDLEKLDEAQKQKVLTFAMGVKAGADAVKTAQADEKRI